MTKPDPLHLASGHMAVAGRAALDLHRALTIARATSSDPAGRHSIALTILVHQNTMKQLAEALEVLPEFFKGNLPTSLRLAADQSC